MFLQILIEARSLQSPRSIIAKGEDTIPFGVNRSDTMSSAQDITLYMLPGTCAIVPHILLNQAKLLFNYEGVSPDDLYSKFSEKNPKQQVPVLVINGEIITENPAIAQAINQLVPEANLFGETPIQYIRVCEWLNYLSAAIHGQAWAPYLRPARFTNDPQAEDGIKAASKQKLLDRFALIESKLPKDGWLLGTKEITAAEAYLLPFYRWAKKHSIDMDRQYPKYSKLMDRLQDLESVKKTLNEIEEVRRSGIGFRDDRME